MGRARVWGEHTHSHSLTHFMALQAFEASLAPSLPHPVPHTYSRNENPVSWNPTALIPFKDTEDSLLTA